MTQSREYLSFLLEDEEYGVHILDVKEVRGWSDVRRIPNTLPHMLGVLERRGEYIPIMDIRQCFDMPPATISATSVIIIVRSQQGVSLGIVVDAVAEVHNLEEQQIKDPPGLHHQDEWYMEGIAAVNDRHLVLINLEQLFDFDQLQQSAQPESANED
ncbi:MULTISPECIES: chemotaxis protein CheW [Salinivibrio]|uniref:Chemotaxis protein CheW n=1 Tax=Salinivibrio kushneri TaxID=1908198 RepID=A0AB36K098_9GAMM|nr:MULTISPECIES: chemotaxis protein CheW [Salinivibrio]OOE36283.1 chemotaxis protein CheW [Salinivibrio kushneri]OOE36677.1 chemotaxis protein CheW [Salinivibrio kushneri]OOE40390.1 chemotaxis protein CheW [Salinivibrio kushneri]OOE47440.1 chemotaxis protein CheW [Salinivibrio kushneri]OOE53343.1 chemotaxis protein CheW [Salinivibrio kushneri]